MHYKKYQSFSPLLPHPHSLQGKSHCLAATEIKKLLTAVKLLAWLGEHASLNINYVQIQVLPLGSWHPTISAACGLPHSGTRVLTSICHAKG